MIRLKKLSQRLSFLAFLVAPCLIHGYASAQNENIASVPNRACGEAKVCVLQVEIDQAKIDAKAADYLDETLVTLKNVQADFYTTRGQLFEVRIQVEKKDAKIERQAGKENELTLQVSKLADAADSRVGAGVWIAIGTAIGIAGSILTFFIAKSG